MNLGQTKSKESTSRSNNKNKNKNKNKTNNCQDRFVAKSLSNFPPSGQSLLNVARRSRSRQSSCLNKGCHCPVSVSVSDDNDAGQQLFEQLLNKEGKVERLLVPDLATEWYRKQKIFTDQVTDAEMDYLRRRAERFEQRNPTRDNYEDPETNYRHRRADGCLCGKGQKERNDEERKEHKEDQEEASQQFANPCTYLACGCGKCQLQHSAQYQQLCRQQRRSRQYCHKLVRCKYLVPPKKPSKTELQPVQQHTWHTERAHATVCATNHSSCTATDRKTGGGATASATPSYIRYEPVQPGPCRKKVSPCSCIYQADGQPMASECIAALQEKCSRLPRRNVRDSATLHRRLHRPERFRRISPEFYKLWQGYEDGLTEKYPLYGRPIRLCPRAKPSCPCEEGATCKIVMEPIEESEEELQEQQAEEHETEAEQEVAVEQELKPQMKPERELQPKPELKMLAVARYNCTDTTCTNTNCTHECQPSCLGCNPANESPPPTGPPIYQVCKADCPGQRDCPGAAECRTRQVTREEWRALPQRPCSRLNQEAEEQGCKDLLLAQPITDQQVQVARKPYVDQRTSRHGEIVIHFHEQRTAQDQQGQLRERLLAKFQQKDLSQVTPKSQSDQCGSLHCQTQKEVRYSCLSVPSMERETKRQRGSTVTFDTKTYEAQQRPSPPPLLPKPVRLTTEQQQQQQQQQPSPCPPTPAPRRPSLDKSQGILGNFAMRCKRVLRPGRHLLYNFSKNYHKRNAPKAESSGNSKESAQMCQDSWTGLQEKQQQEEKEQEQEQEQEEVKKQQQQQQQQKELELQQQQQQEEQHQELPLACNQQKAQYAVQSEASKTRQQGPTLQATACNDLSTLKPPQFEHIYPCNSGINQIYVASTPAPAKVASSTNIANAQRRQQWMKYSPQLLRRKARLFASTKPTTKQGTKRSSARNRQHNMVTQLERPQQRIAACVNRSKATAGKTSPTPDEANLRRRGGKPKRNLRYAYDEQRRDQLATAVKFALALPQAKTDGKPIRRNLAFSQGNSISSQLWHFGDKPKYFSWKRRRWPVTPINSRQSMVSMSSLQAKIGANNDTSTDIMTKQEERLTNVTYFVQERKQQQGREHEHQRQQGDPREQKEPRATAKEDQRQQGDPRRQKATPKEDQRQQADPRAQIEPRAFPKEDQRHQKDLRKQIEPRAPHQEKQREQRYPQEKRDTGGQKEPREQEYYQEQRDRRNQRDSREQQSNLKQRVITKEYHKFQDFSEKKVPPPVMPRKPRQELFQAQQSTRDHVEQRELPRIQQDLREQKDHRAQRYTPEQRELQTMSQVQRELSRSPQDLRDTRRQQGAPYLSQELWNRQEQRDPRDQRDPRNQRVQRDPRDQRDPRGQRESRELRLFVRDQQVSRQLPRSVSQVIQQQEHARQEELPQSTAPPIPAVTLSRPSRTLMKTAQQVWQRLESTMEAQKPPPLLLVRSATPTPGQRISLDRTSKYNNNHNHINRTRSGCDLQFRDEAQQQRRQPCNAQDLERRRLAVSMPRASSSVRNLRSASEVPTTSRAAYQLVDRLDQTKPQVPPQSVSIPRGSNISYRQLVPPNRARIETAGGGVTGGGGAASLVQRPLPPLNVQPSSYASPAGNLPSYSESYGYPPKNSTNCPMPQRTPGSILKTTPKPVQHPVKRVNFERERGGSVPPSPYLMEYYKRHTRDPQSSNLAPPVTECCREALKAAKKTRPSLFAVASVNSLDEEKEEQKEQPFRLRYSHDRLPRYVSDDYVRREGVPLPANAPLLTTPEFDEQQLPMNAQLLLNEDDYRPLRKAREQRYVAPPVAMVSELEFGTFFHQTREFNLPEEPQGDVDPPEMMTKLMKTLQVRHHGMKMQTKEKPDDVNTFTANNDAFYIGSGTGKAGAATAAAAAARLENEKSWRNWMHERDPPKPPGLNLTCGEHGKDNTYLPRRRCNLRRLPDDPVVIAPTHSGLRQQQVLQNCLPVLFYGRSDGGGPR